MLRQALFIARTDLRSMLRQRETLVWVFVMPFLFFYFIGTVTGGGGGVGPNLDQTVRLRVEGPREGGVVQAQLFDALRAANFELELEGDEVEEPTTKRRLVLPTDYGAHANLTESVLAGEPVTLRFVREGDGNAADLEKLRLSRAVYGVLADLVVLKADGVDVSPAAFTALHDAPRNLTLAVEAAGKRKVIPNGYSQTIPGTMVMFTMMILLTSGAIALVTERQQGLLRRLAATPIPRGAVVAGKWLGKMALAVVQLAFAMAAGTLVFGMDWGEHLGAVALVLFAWAAFNASLAIVLANAVRSEAQMSGVGVISTLLLAALGGCWWPIEITPSWMQSLARFLPTGATMDAMHQLVNFGNPPSAALGAVLALGAGALALGWLGARGFRYQ
ncbi:MAG: ABC transporter permease [Planctomycetes bacterium]|nr:ABC transporter permease [Planctomycetota bacterium]